MSRRQLGEASLRRLVLMRHAKAERHSADGSDFDRPLAPRGRNDAALMGKVLAQAGVRPDKVVVSSAVRTLQTWEALSPAFPDAEVVTTRALYHAEPGVILSVIEQEDDVECLMVVAHNPGVHALALRLLQWASAPPSIQARFERGFPTSTAAVFEIDEAGRATYDGLYLAAEHGGGGGE